MLLLIFLIAEPERIDNLLANAKKMREDFIPWDSMFLKGPELFL
jgi:hypothetical protein